MIPANIRKDVDDTAYLYDLVGKLNSLAGSLRYGHMTSNAPDIPQVMMDVMKSYEEAGRALFRISERHK